MGQEAAASGRAINAAHNQCSHTTARKATMRNVVLGQHFQVKLMVNRVNNNVHRRRGCEMSQSYSADKAERCRKIGTVYIIESR